MINIIAIIGIIDGIIGISGLFLIVKYNRHHQYLATVGAIMAVFAFSLPIISLFVSNLTN